jgi:hypothetical protein
MGSTVRCFRGQIGAQEPQWSQVLQRSVETRTRSVQEKLSIAFTFCATVEIEIKYGDANRAKERLQKLRLVVQRLTAHINDPRHVFGQQSKEFRDQLVQLRKRLGGLESQIE